MHVGEQGLEHRSFEGIHGTIDLKMLISMVMSHYKLPVNFPLLTREPQEQAEIWVVSSVSTNAAPGSLSIILLAELMP